jgi:hypothetical protein
MAQENIMIGKSEPREHHGIFLRLKEAEQEREKVECAINIPDFGFEEDENFEPIELILVSWDNKYYIVDKRWS